MTLLAALRTTSALRPNVQAGLGALTAAHRSLIYTSQRRRVVDSIDLDAAARPAFPDANRWDYIMSVPDVRAIVGLEPHPAKDGEIRVIIAKKQQAQTYLKAHLQASRRVTKWIWVTKGRVGFSRSERARKLLDQNGITFGGRLVRTF
jgi:hypothetical protein